MVDVSMWNTKMGVLRTSCWSCMRDRRISRLLYWQVCDTKCYKVSALWSRDYLLRPIHIHTHTRTHKKKEAHTTTPPHTNPTTMTNYVPTQHSEAEISALELWQKIPRGSLHGAVPSLFVLDTRAARASSHRFRVVLFLEGRSPEHVVMVWIFWSRQAVV